MGAQNDNGKSRKANTMKPDQIIQATEESLPRIAARILIPPELWEHDYSGELFCIKCNVITEQTMAVKAGCIEPDPVPLTWPEAMKWRDWCVEKYGSDKFRDALIEVYMSMVPERKYVKWSFTSKLRYTMYHFVISGEPIHYIKAACLCAGEGGSDETV